MALETAAARARPAAALPPGLAPAAQPRRSEAVALMAAGAALLVAGAVIGGDAGTLVMVAGAGIGAYGVYLYFRD